MKKMRIVNNKFIICAVITVEIITVAGIMYAIYKKLQQGHGSSVHPLNKESLIHPATSELTNYYEPKPDSEEVESAAWLKEKVVYKINGDSLRSDKEYEPQKDSRVYRIEALGDSHTYGLYINESDIWTTLLAKKLNQYCNTYSFEVLNLGVPGYDIQYSLERFLTRGQKYHPDLLIWFIKGEDYTQINEKMLEVKKELKTANPGKSETEYWDLAWPALVAREGAANLRKTNQKLISGISSAYSGKLVTMAYPQAPKEDLNFLDQFAASRKNTYLFKSIPTIYNDNSLNFYPYDKHPNKKGHEIIAQNLFDYLVKANLIPCKK